MSIVFCAISALGSARAAQTSMDANLSVLVFNTQSVKGDQHRNLETILDADADVVALPELSPEMVELLEADERINERYPYYWTNDRRVRGQLLMLSRWPATELLGRVGASGMAMTPAVVVHGMQIAAPQGPVGVLVIHPLAPKSYKWWRNGNSVVHRTIDVVNEARQLGLPIVVAGDINATPTGWRSTALHTHAGLARAKPRITPVGTWPTWSVWPMKLAIDDVWVSPDVRVVSWKALDRSGSDHHPVFVRLRYDAGWAQESGD